MKIDILQTKPSETSSSCLAWSAYLDKSWIRCAILAVIGFLARLPSLQGQLIWDDNYLARDNPLIKSPLFVLEIFRHYLFLDSSSPHYRPVQNLSLMFDYAVWNTQYFGFHLTNILLHVLSSILLYFLLRRILGSLRLDRNRVDPSLVAFVCAAIWVVHPVHSAAVDYISGRADSLAFVFAGTAWLLFFEANDAKNSLTRVLFYVLSTITGLAALCSRESACIWLALFLVDQMVLGPAGRKKWLTILVSCGMLLVYAGLRQLPDHHAIQSHPGPSFAIRVVLMLRALGDYARLMLFPANLHMERSVFEASAFETKDLRERLMELEYLSLIGAAAAAAFAAAGVRRGPGQRLRLLGVSWFVIGFLPISNLFDLNASVAEHWLYLPSVGFILFLAGCAIDFPAHLRRLTIGIATVAVVALGVRSFFRSSDWSEQETFYLRTANAGGMSCRIGVNLGQAYATKGDYVKAEKIFRNVVRIQPDYTVARNNLADALTHLGREDEAKNVLASATADAHTSMKDYPRTWVAALNYAHLLSRRDDLDGSLGVLEKARKDYPDNWELLAAEAEIFRTKDQFEAALALLQPYANNNWWHYAAWMALGRVRAEKGDVDLAEAALRHASWLDIRSTEPLNLIAVMRMGQNRFDDAWRAQRRAVARQPDEPRQYVLLSNILEKMGRTDEARSALAQIARLRSLAESSSGAN